MRNKKRNKEPIALNATYTHFIINFILAILIIIIGVKLVNADPIYDANIIGGNSTVFLAAFPNFTCDPSPCVFQDATKFKLPYYYKIVSLYKRTDTTYIMVDGIFRHSKVDAIVLYVKPHNGSDFYLYFASTTTSLKSKFGEPFMLTDGVYAWSGATDVLLHPDYNKKSFILMFGTDVFFKTLIGVSF
jgi:hypothetical protein